ncbi:prepilin peptidase [Jeotgalibaca porci]|uniref:Prepilin peptidase n=1 Tax=Jeotgalibaca porci TaxID=1868793 RepID=A0A6G7WIU3_9LACT|nr:A24 family peptidase [Jeotgalibaca porci]QIK52139.1 prepilin peptidase [Jeotgalibaca porci]
MDVIFTLIFFIYGLIFGSFFNVVGLRVPKGSLFSQTRSYCDTCERTLTWKELIPVFSFMIQKGKCRKCQEEISPLYPFMELATGILVAFTYYRFGFSPALLLGLLLISLVIPITVSDIAYRRIPNKILLFFFPLFLIYHLVFPLTPLWDALLGAGIAFTLLLLILFLSKGGMGAGDLKYFTLLGFVFGTKGFLLTFFLAVLFGLVGGLITMKRTKQGAKTLIPFGPYIGLAAMTVLFYGDALITWYVSLLGF